MKTFKGKILYNPSGKAGEYGYWGANTHVGCSHDCSYCYCKKGVLGSAMGGITPTLKKCLNKFNNAEKNFIYAMDVFKKEVAQNLEEVKKYGIFFSFTTDPLLEEVENYTWAMTMHCNTLGVPVKILTKRADWVEDTLSWLDRSNSDNADLEWRKIIAFGFTLTGHDELEPGASTNAERIEAMKQLHKAGFKTFASIEPIINLVDSFEMISATNGFCDLYKIGLFSGQKYDRNELQLFVQGVIEQVKFYGSKIYFKDSLLKLANIERSELFDSCVTRDYNLFQ